MRHTARKERVPLRRVLIHVGIEGVAGEMGEVLDIIHCHGTGRCVDGLANRQVVEAARERMRGASTSDAPGTQRPLIEDRISGLP